MQNFYLNESTAARRRLPFVMLLSSDGTTPGTGLTFSSSDIFISKNGAAEFASSGSVTEIGGGTYYYSLQQYELDTFGFLQARVVKSSYRTFFGLAQVLGCNVYDSGRLGLTSLPNTTPGGLGGLPTVDANNGVTISSASRLDMASGVWAYTSWSNFGVNTAGSGLNFILNKTTNLTFTGTNVHTAVQTYATNQDPGTYILLTPSNKLYTDSSGVVRADIVKVNGSGVNPTSSIDANVVSYASTMSPSEQVFINSSNKLLTNSVGMVSVADSGIRKSSYVSMVEPTGVPSFPLSPMDATSWMFLRSRSKSDTTAFADAIYNAAGTPIASSVFTTDGSHFTRAAYV